jgi:hypothetical protein
LEHSRVSNPSKAGPFRRSSQLGGDAEAESLADLKFSVSPRNIKGSTQRPSRRLLIHSNSPGEKLAFLSGIKDQQRKLMNKSNVKASLLDLYNN